MSDSSKLKGVILCGGEGSRLRPLTYYFQKVMIPIGLSQKPLLEYTIKLLVKNGIQEILLLVGYKAEQIINYFENGERFGVKIDYMKDKPGVSGTGNALIEAYLAGKISKKEKLLIYYGDILSNIRISKMYQEHFDFKATATLAIAKKYRVRVGVVSIENDRVVGLVEKPSLDLPITIGVLVVNGNVLKDLKDLSEKKKSLDIMNDLIPHLIDKGEHVHAYFHDSFWYDVGSIERYEKLDNEAVEKFLGKKPQ